MFRHLQGIKHAMGALLISIICGFGAYLIFNIIYNLHLHPLRHFPGPKLWQANHLLRLRAATKGTLEASIKQFHEQYGPVVRYAPNELSFTSPEAWKDIYGFGQHALPKDPSFYKLMQLSRDGSPSILTADAHQHPRVRKALSYAFSERALREQEPFVRVYVDLLIKRLRERASGADPIVDLVEWYSFTAFDIIGDLAIDQSFECLEQGRFNAWIEGLANLFRLGAIVHALVIATHAGFLKLLRAIGPKRLKESRQRHLDFVGKWAEQRLAIDVDRERSDFISYVSKREGEERLSNGEIEANTNFLLMAGTETTATSLSAITFYMLKNIRALRRVTAEVHGAFDREQDITFTTAAERLPYLQACIDEGLRLHPPVPTALPRRTPKGSVIRIAGEIVPGNVKVGVHALSASHSPRNFHRASEFLPERWLTTIDADNGDVDEKASPFCGDRHAASQPFSYGPRNCLGRPFAYNELRVILARMLWNFDLSLLPQSVDWEKQKVFSVWEKGPLMVRINSSWSTGAACR